MPRQGYHDGESALTVTILSICIVIGSTCAEFQTPPQLCVRRRLTQHPHHDQHLCPGELCGFDPEHLSWVVCYGLIGQVLDTLKAVGGVDNQQAQEDGEGDSVGHELHEWASQDLTKLEVRRLRIF